MRTIMDIPAALAGAATRPKRYPANADLTLEQIEFINLINRPVLSDLFAAGHSF